MTLWRLLLSGIDRTANGSLFQTEPLSVITKRRCRRSRRAVLKYLSNKLPHGRSHKR